MSKSRSPYHRGRRREYSEKPQSMRQEQKPQARPMPLGRKCNPLCPLFRCSKRALIITTRAIRGKPVRVAFCRWIGDECIGASCQYAFCATRSLLPNGECLHAVQKTTGKEKDIIEELKEEEINDKMKSLLTKRFGRKDLDAF